MLSVPITSVWLVGYKNIWWAHNRPAFSIFSGGSCFDGSLQLQNFYINSLSIPDINSKSISNIHVIRNWLIITQKLGPDWSWNNCFERQNEEKTLKLVQKMVFY